MKHIEHMNWRYSILNKKSKEVTQFCVSTSSIQGSWVNKKSNWKGSKNWQIGLTSSWMTHNLVCLIKSEQKNWVQKLAIDKKSTIFVQFLWNLVKMIASQENHFHQVSWRLDKNYGFIINIQFWSVSRFFSSDLR